ncbi:MAG: hypothetical protein IJ766_00565 [Clostridia bacterium]|nr:hypothetical protein [Clostridia bacterium]
MQNTSPQKKGNATYTPDDAERITETDARVIKKIKRILAKGNNAEVKMKKDGTLTVYEVKKSIV